MAEESAKLRIPYIAAAQAQKHVTHNEAMTLLDTLVQLSVIDKDLTAPPGSPGEGDTYIVAGAGGTATGAWVGWEKRVARYIDGTWRSYLPGEGDGAGWLAWVIDEGALYVFDGDAWLDTNLHLVEGGATAVAGKNHIINGAMMVAQRGTSFTSSTTPSNNDDTYLLDRWILLADGADTVDVTQQLVNGRYWLRLDVETVDRKFGIFQPIEFNNCIGLIDEAVALQARLYTAGSGKLDNVKIAVVYRTGTADILTSDIVSAWGAEGTNPTLASDWVYASTPANLGVTTGENIYAAAGAVPGTATNIGVFIWSDVTDTDLGDFLYVTDVQLEAGAAATDFDRRLYASEILACYPYCENLVPAAEMVAAGLAISTTQAYIALRYQVRKRVIPTLSVGTIGNLRVYSAAGSALTATGSSGFFNVGRHGALFTPTVASGLTAAQGTMLAAVGDAQLLAEAEL